MKVQVNVSDEMVGKIDKYAKAIGVSRSSFCSVLIGQGVMGYDKSMSVLNSIQEQLGDKTIDVLNSAIFSVSDNL